MPIALISNDVKITTECRLYGKELGLVIINVFNKKARIVCVLSCVNWINILVTLKKNPTIKSFPINMYEGKDHSKLKLYNAVCWLLTTKKKTINQKHLHRRLVVTFGDFVIPDKIFFSTVKCERENSIFSKCILCFMVMGKKTEKKSTFFPSWRTQN